MNSKHIGSSFDDFLEEEELLADADAVAIKRVIAYQVTRMMESKHLSKTAMAKQMHTSRSALDRLLDPTTLQTLERAAHAIGKRLRIEFA